jgi:hypothetical protein
LVSWCWLTIKSRYFLKCTNLTGHYTDTIMFRWIASVWIVAMMRWHIQRSKLAQLMKGRQCFTLVQNASKRYSPSCVFL